MSLLTLPLRLLILLLTSILLALGQIRANKVRSCLTAIGIIIGIASVTAVIAALTGLRANILAEFETLGTNKMYIFERAPTGTVQRAASRERNQFRWRDFDGLLASCPSVSSLTRMAETQLPISFGTRSESAASIIGIEPAWHQIEGRTITAGRPFSLIDLQQARPVCLVSTDAIDKLRLDRDPSGQFLTVGHRRFRIVGVVQRADSMFAEGGSQRIEVIVPLTTVLARSPRMPLYAIATSRAPEVSEDAQAEVNSFLRRQRRLAPGEEANFQIEVIERYLTQFNRIAATITLVATGIVGISLLVGGVGIMNIMLVSVSERTREIGLRKAVGARPSAILLQFLVEAVMLCLLGGALGLAAGHGLTRLMTGIPGAGLEKAAIPLWAVALSFGFSASVGLIFGMFPAAKAARLDPIEALRHE